MQTMRWNWWWMPLEWTSIRCLCWYKTVRVFSLQFHDTSYKKWFKIFFSKVPKLTCMHPNNKESDCKRSSCECDLEYVTNVVQSVKADLYNIKFSRTQLNFEVKFQKKIFIIPDSKHRTRNCNIFPFRVYVQMKNQSCFEVRSVNPIHAAANIRTDFHSIQENALAVKIEHTIPICSIVAR